MNTTLNLDEVYSKISKAEEGIKNPPKEPTVPPESTQEQATTMPKAPITEVMSPIEDTEKAQLSSEINKLQEELGFYRNESKGPSNKVYSEFYDEYGKETFYVKNISGTHVILDIDGMDKVEKGKCVDLLNFTDEESIKNSKVFRKVTRGIGTDKLLERITPQEFLNYLQEQARNKKKSDSLNEQAIKRTENSNPEDTKSSVADNIRPMVKNMVHKLGLYYNDTTANKGVNPIQFIQWIYDEKLTEEEIEYTMSSATDKDVRTALIEKKQKLIQDRM